MTGWNRVLKFWVIFVIATLNINLVQIFSSPFKLISKSIYTSIIDYSKASFSKFLVILLNLQGNGSVVRVYNPVTVQPQSVIFSNHQLYTDWIYIWTLLYKLESNADHLIIILKHSLKHIPILGWGMQFFNFIFLRRSWAVDNKTLSNQLHQLSANSNPYTLLLFPEGTTISNDSRPKSNNFTKKIGVEDFHHLLYPRVTGLLHSLRSLSHNPNLQVIDSTLAYPDIPPGVYGQDWYTLKNTFLRRISPDIIHLHMSSWKLCDIPIHSDDLFTSWLLQRWHEKEQRLRVFQESHTLDPSGKYQDIPLNLTHPLAHTLDAFIYFVPIILEFASQAAQPTRVTSSNCTTTHLGLDDEFTESHCSAVNSRLFVVAVAMTEVFISQFLSLGDNFSEEIAIFLVCLVFSTSKVFLEKAHSVSSAVLLRRGALGIALFKNLVMCLHGAFLIHMAIHLALLVVEHAYCLLEVRVL
ncbi:hypothetical protein E3P81_02854 [Wallemia ichthyophaga]|nr:hypothetical protein E3P91_00696 [Wallemia ichthyophaga]TIA89588.1 hypothetical protein E3P97_02970 [Wallemia ichthyophaga]TIB00634.1 hypothetical protein E3P96_02611 [Wallemia ichthyophaga]TIB30755.1 hypothetical protein E3P85_02613 [Wallemia ichthyophaga]TIB45377.1 hypothetical protein E3P82_02855 [Wallemia ichthyophaga]